MLGNNVRQEDMPKLMTQINNDDLQTQLATSLRMIQLSGECDRTHTCFEGNDKTTMQQLSEQLQEVESIYQQRS